MAPTSALILFSASECVSSLIYVAEFAVGGTCVNNHSSEASSFSSKAFVLACDSNFDTWAELSSDEFTG